MTGPTLPDIVAEGRRVVAAGDEAGVPLRLLGGVAIALQAGGTMPAGLEREFKDIDVVTAGGRAGAVEAALVAAGYEPNANFNAMRSHTRMLFYDVPNERQLDVFVDRFSMCHGLDLADRLAVDAETIPAADLLLTKLQIVELNAKDRDDTYALLATVALSDDDSGISRERLTEVCGSDWGWHHTIEANLAKLRAGLAARGLAAEAAATVTERLDALEQLLEEMPKTRGWRMRARVGERKRWYELPEEVDR